VPTDSYWLAEAVDPLPSAGWQGHPDVVVIGGGVTGCSCALTLAEAGVRVRLHEVREIAAGASGRNGGFALRGATVAYDVARDRLGPEQARRLMDLTERSQARLEQLAGDAFRRVGSLRLAADERERDELRREHDALRTDGFAVEWVDELTGPLDTLYAGAILHPHDGALQPARWVRRLARRAADAGADVREHSPMDVESVEADAVVVCGDGYTAQLLPELAALVVPTRGQVLVTEPLPVQQYPRPHYARAGWDYWQQLPDGRLVLGGQRDAALAEESTEVDAVTPAVQDRLEDLLEALVGHRPRVEGRWSGMWGTTPDLLPLVGHVPGRDGVWLAGGYSGHGNVLGLACGDLVARAVLGSPPAELELFDPARLG
jgi:glycine/D-amino acid oxidase-like deaminating enzyme